MDIQIVEGSLHEALTVLRKLPEFDKMQADEYYIEKTGDRQPLILLAMLGSELIGCKVGYNRYKDGSFYSALGGVLPAHRQSGIARRLADAQEIWAKEKGYESIKFKTLNRHKNMIIFAIKNGFSLYNIKPKDELEHYRIEMIKNL